MYRRQEQIDLGALVRDLLDLYRDSVDELGFRLDSSVADGVAMRADAMQMRRLLSNLLDNALKYCPPGSRIHVELAPGPRLVVEDDGPGIPPAQRERLFEKFARGSQGSGHGLGLALARAIAQRHGLDLRLVPAAKGARFVLQPEPTR